MIRSAIGSGKVYSGAPYHYRFMRPGTESVDRLLEPSHK
jgi:hypothetical protein